MKMKRLLLYFLCANLFLTVFFIGNTSGYRMQKEAGLNLLKNKISPPSIDVNTNLNELKIKSSSSLNARTAYAIVVGISDYPGTINDLSYCDDDALDVYNLLMDEFNFDPSNVYYFIDSAATQGQISSAFDTIASKIDSNDVFFFYYSGHGGADTTNVGEFSNSIASPHPYPGTYDNTWSIFHTDAAYMRVHFSQINVHYNDYLLLGDTDIASGWYYYDYAGSYTNFWSGWVPVLSDNSIYIRLFSAGSPSDWGFEIDKYEVEIYDGTHYLCSYDSLDSHSKSYFDTLLDSKLDAMNYDEAYIVMDSCHSGGLIPEVYDIGRTIVSASLDDQYSIEWSDKHNGVFTYHFLDSFDSAPDLNGDGVISFEESFNDLYPKVVATSTSEGYTHNPQFNDSILGENILTPKLINISLTPIGENLTYSFSVVGTGKLEKLSLYVAQTTPTPLNTTVDLTLISTTPTGFENYTGNVTLTGATNIQSYGLYGEIWGKQILMFNSSVGAGDTDGDGIDDIVELMSGMNINSADTDGDGLTDYIEFYGLSDPRYTDTDGDGLGDFAEVNTHLTDPSHPDTDRDGMNDYFEVCYGLDPLFWFDAFLDKDGDSLNNFLECQLGSDPTNSDTDSDGMPDGWEYDYGLDLLVDDATEDLDSDGLDNLGEYTHDTDPTNPDTDGDLLSDGIEVSFWTDPLNPLSNGVTLVLNFSTIGMAAILAVYIPHKYKKQARLSKKLDGKFSIKKDVKTINALVINKIKKPSYSRPILSGYGSPHLSYSQPIFPSYATVSTSIGNVCPSCGNKNQPSQKFCTNCGGML